MKHYFKEVPSNWFDYPEVYDMAIQKASVNQNTLFVELGVWFGQSMSYAGVEILNSGKPIKLHGIDSFLHGDQPDDNAPYDQTRHTEALRYTQSVRDAVEIIHADTRNAYKSYEDASIDFLFIDANHVYENVALDIKNWFPKVKKGGTIAGHDYNHNAFPGVVQAVNEFFGEENITVSAQSKSWIHEVPNE